MTTQRIEISIEKQNLQFYEDGQQLFECTVSTALNGAGQQQNSECTPCGRHRIAEKIGEGEPVNSVFVGRRPTGEIYRPELRERYPERDWILTRILWLEGLEDGINCGGQVDSKARYIYIHGTPDDVVMGKTGSHGCVRMRNNDVLQLFDRIEVGIEVMITA